MKKNKAIGIVLVVLGLGVIAGLFINEAKFWYPIDYVTIGVCVITGILLVKGK